MGRLSACGSTVALLCASAAAQISGRVVAGDMAPPEPALVTVRCPGFSPWTGYTDKRGEFVAALSEASGAAPGATASAGAWACRVEASARGYQRAVVDVTDTEATGLLLKL